MQARERHPYLQEFQNDWATEEIVKQFIKNRRNNSYHKEYIPVPAKYGYLKANAAKRNPSAPRGRQAKFAKVDAAAKKATKKRTATSKSKSGKALDSKGAKRKGKRNAVVTDEDEDAEMSDAVGSVGSAEGEDD
ncbi:hypothetical protein B0H10DRAFT_511046 [Mycena sp. CBHHK59/15]|nr:hypothetical protein B0H10DRAFT_511046 [Mycena sp. CBHHK59/15]